ncbi:Protein KRI1 homolog, partial [Geodia barretti]
MCAQMLTADVEKDFLRTLSLIHSRDPRIYDNKTQFFRKDENKEQRERKEEKKENKPMFLKDYERKQCWREDPPLWTEGGDKGREEEEEGD